MSSVMESVRQLVSQAAQADAPVLFRGDSGTGKGVLARLLHAGSARSQGPFVAVDCPTLTGNLLASEFFGYARGAFTGAIGTKPGRVEAANGGTLFLDEVAEVPLESQAKLLRFVQEKVFERVGDPRTRRSDVRIVASTHHDLEADVRNGSFRADLFYCLNVIEIRVPALRDRREDIIPLAHEILKTVSLTLDRGAVRFSAAAEHALASYDWPGNVRELRHVIERAMILCPDPVLDLDALPLRLAEGAPSST